jgi:hypothetical protein
VLPARAAAAAACIDSDDSGGGTTTCGPEGETGPVGIGLYGVGAVVDAAAGGAVGAGANTVSDVTGPDGKSWGGAAGAGTDVAAGTGTGCDVAGCTGAVTEAGW